MRKLTALVAAVFLVVARGSLACAEESKKGTSKSGDAKKPPVVFCPEGTTTDMTLKAGKDVDLSKVKAGDKVEASIMKSTLTGVKAAPAEPAAAPAEAPKPAPRAPVGC